VNYRIYHTAVFVLMLVLASACSVTKDLKEDEKLLYATAIKIDKTGIAEQEELAANIVQKPNRRLLFIFPLYLRVHSAYNDDKLEKRNAKKEAKINRKNEKRLAKGKQEKAFKPVWGYRIKHNIGEEPVIVDSNETERSVKQLKLHLAQLGYYRANVEVSRKNKWGKRLKVTYSITAGEPTLISDYRFNIEDYDIFSKNSEVINGSLIKKGKPLNIEQLEKERIRVTKALRNKGYYYFNSQYVSFEVDTFQIPKRAVVKELIENPYTAYTSSGGSDSLAVNKHVQFTVNKVYINAAYDPQFENVSSDTAIINDFIFTNLAQLNFKPNTLLKSIFIKPGALYSQEVQEYTYRRLNALKNFKFINIKYIQRSDNTLDCYINMSPSLPQSLAIESEGTNTGGNLGVAGNLSYTHRNIFRGTESLNIRLRGGFESQPTSNTGGSVQDESAVNIGDVSLFNTIEYGIDFSLNIPELLIPKKVSSFSLPKYNNPKTIFNLNFNFQQRPDYTRSLINSSMAYQWSAATKQTNLFVFQPLGISLIKIDKSDEFQKTLDEINNPFYTATYSDQLIVGTKLNHTWTNQNLGKDRNFNFNRAQIETAGNALSLMSQSMQLDEIDGHYEIDSIQFAQFLKLDNDFRWYNVLSENTRMVYRFYGGVGIPYGNSSALPFDKSFFAGGANDIRAWRARSLGPGSLPDSLKQGIDQVGDIILELNLEYRYKLTKTVEGALFADIGNIWLHDGEDRPESAVFRTDRFYKELGVGLGTGLRFDFSFLLLRLDLGVQVHDPAQAPGERWIYQAKPLYEELNGKPYTLQYTLNLGIDYPF
jgi:outer membrane translocation and assembly module TamA